MHTQNLIIGFGKAGKTLAADLAKHGQQVVLVEQSAQMYGGTCINIGCIPSKKLIVESEQRGHNADKAAVFAAAMNAKNTLIPKLRAANFAKLDNLDGVTVLNARAEFLDDRTVKLTDPDGGEQTLTAERIFINTGATPRRLVIIGGGYIGLEFAFMFHAFGSEITILDGGDRFLPREDRDIAEEMLRVLNNKGIKVLQGVKIEAFRDNTADTSVITSQGEFTTDAVLVGVGRVPNTQGLGLANAGIETDPRGFILVDDHLRVQGKNHIWAMGDVAGSPMFTYISLDDYRIVREQLFGDGKRNRADRTPFPTATFTEPPLAHIGLTETAAQQSGREVKVLKLKADAIPKAKILNQTDGLLKAVVDAHSGEILGVTLFCAEAHEIINLFKMAIDHRIPATYIKNQIFTHPTIAEGLNDLFAGC